MNFKYYLIAVLLFVGLSTSAQEKKNKKSNEKEIKVENLKQEKKEFKKEKEVKDESRDKSIRGDKEKVNNGNSYGKNKRELKGKEFGQERAKSEQNKKSDKLDKSTNENDKSQKKLNENSKTTKK